MRRPLCLLFLISAASAASLAAAEGATVPAVLDPEAPSSGHLDLPSWRRAALATWPTSVVTDPEAAAAVDHAGAQWRLFERLEAGMPPLLTTLEDGAWVVFNGGPGVMDPDGRHQMRLISEFAVLLDDGTGRWHARMLPLVQTGSDGPLPADLLPGFEGATDDDAFAAAFHDRFAAFGSFGALAGLTSADFEARQPAERSEPLWLELDLAVVIEALRQRDVPGFGYPVLETLFPSWREWQPRADIALWPEDGEWRSRLVLTGIRDLAQPTIDADLLGLARADDDLVAAVALDLEGLVELFTTLATEEDLDGLDLAEIEREWGRVCSVPLRELLAAFSGDVLVVGSAAGPLPLLAGVFELEDPERVRTALGEILAEVDGFALEGEEDVWSLPTPVGPIRFQIGGQRLVIGNALPRVEALAGGAPGDADLTAAGSVLVRFSPPETLVALGYGLIAQAEEQLSPSASDQLADRAGWYLRQVVSQSEQPGGPSDEELVAAVAEGNSENWYHYLIGNALAVLAGAAGAEGVDVLVRQSMGLYRNADLMDPEQQVVLLWRLDDGYRGTTRVYAQAEDPEQALADAGYRRISGPAADALPVLADPGPVVFDARWLPPLPVVQRHLGTYRLDLVADDERWELRERGLPVATTLASIGATMLWAGGRFLAEELAEARDQRRFVAFVETLGRPLAEGVSLPDQAFGLLLPADVSMEQAADVLGCEVADVAEELAALGRWFREPITGRQVVWAVPVGREVVLLTRDGAVETRSQWSWQRELEAALEAREQAGADDF